MKRFFWAGVSLSGVAILVSVFLLGVSPSHARAHCQVPCGIYDDAARISRLREDATTIDKAITNIVTLSGRHDPQSLNQITRWITTKEDHGSHVIKVVAEYFLTQKVKPVASGAAGYDGYLRKLADHHAVMVAAMKCKQHVDASYVAALRAAIDALAKHYQ